MLSIILRNKISTEATMLIWNIREIKQLWNYIKIDEFYISIIKKQNMQRKNNKFRRLYNFNKQKYKLSVL
jgi:hypothetical protein